MTVGQKASLSLLVAVLIFAAFTVAAFSGLFNILEARFYNPTVTRQYDSALDALAKAADTYHRLNEERFAAALEQDAIKRSFLPNLSAQDAFARSNLLGKLQEEMPGFAGLRIIDQNGKRTHFSTFPADILRKTEVETLFRDYGQPGDLAWAAVAAPEGAKPGLLIDEGSGRFIYSLPVRDNSGIYRGTALVTLSPSGLLDALVKGGLLQVGEQLTPAGSHGILLKAPGSGKELLAARVAELWAQGLGARPLTLAENVAGSSWVLFTREGQGGFRIGMVLPASSFVFPPVMRILLLAAFLVTSFLLVFLVFNLRQGRTAVIEERIKRYHIGMLEASYSEKADRDLGRWKRQLEARRAEYKVAIKADIGKLGKDREVEADTLIDKSWDEILSVLGRRVEEADRIGGPSLKEIERLITEALKRATFVLPASTLVAAEAPAAGAPARRPAPTRIAAPVEEAEAIEELGEEPAEEAEAVEELEELEAEPVEKAEAAEKRGEAEAPEELEELEAEPVEAEPVAEEELEAEELEELEAEPVEEAESVEELEAVAGEEAEQPLAGTPAPEIPSALAAISSEEAEPIEELEAVAAFEEADSGEAAGGVAAGGVDYSERAYFLASIDEDLIPVIPESTGLELFDDGDISEIIGFLDMSSSEDRDNLEVLSVVEAGDFDLPALPYEEGSAKPQRGGLLDRASRLASRAVKREAVQASETEVTASLEFDDGEGPIIFTRKDEIGTTADAGFELDLSSIDLSPLKAIDAALGELGNLMATEVGKALPESPELRVRPGTDSDFPALHDPAWIAGPGGKRTAISGRLVDADSSDEDSPLDLDESLGAFEPYGTSATGSGFRASSPVEGDLPLDDEGRWNGSPAAAEGPSWEGYDSEAPDEEGEGGEPAGIGPIVMRDGLYLLEPSLLDQAHPSSDDDKARRIVLDPGLRSLVDAVLRHGPDLADEGNPSSFDRP